MALGTYGIVRPADVSPDDVDIILHYTASRDVTDNFFTKKIKFTEHSNTLLPQRRYRR